ncbi:hypothetical protein Catovirus_1_496 [Catovirus CTV1]|uniref:Uncharacterized protein n=1 Tax=Catovirus CTV1 TaxID=1977631 RepID=A0A1V0S9Q6_9VIRU|nr:hypothetical protein Catovirus_1_496 [Catovirus CTV1]
MLTNANKKHISLYCPNLKKFDGTLHFPRKPYKKFYVPLADDFNSDDKYMSYCKYLYHCSKDKSIKSLGIGKFIEDYIVRHLSPNEKTVNPENIYAYLYNNTSADILKNKDKYEKLIKENQNQSNPVQKLSGTQKTYCNETVYKSINLMLTVGFIYIN